MPVILVIDDNKDNLVVITALLSYAFFDTRIITALSGREGIEKAHLEHPDVILLDLVMPEMDGFEVCATLKKDPVLQGVPVVILTAAKTDATSRIKAFKLGADAFITKPLDETELTAQVAAMLRIKQSEDRVRQENLQLEALVQERTKELEKSTIAALNLMEDLKVEIDERRGAEDALRESEERYRRITEGLSDYLYTVRVRDGRAIETTHSAACEAVTGYTAEELASNLYLWIDMVPMEEHDLIKEQVHYILSTKELPAHFPPVEHRILRKDGEMRWVSDTPILKFDSGGTLISYDGVVKDITDRRQAEEALHENENKLQTLMNALPIAIAWSDTAGNIEYFNGKFRELFGYNCEEIPTVDQWRRKVYPDKGYRESIPPLNQLIAQAREQGQMAEPLESTITCKDGSIRQVLRTGAFISNRFLAIFDDITERKQAEVTIRESEMKYRSLFENAVEGIFQSTPGGLCITANPAHARLFGYDSPQEFMERYTNIAKQHYAHPEDRVAFKKILEKEGVIRGFEVQLINKEGHPVWASLNARLVKDNEGNILYYEGTTEDITRRKTAEEALIKSQARLSNIIDFLPEATLVVDLEGKIIAWNRAIEDMTGFSAEQMLGKGDFEYAIPFYGERRPILLDLLSSWCGDTEKNYSFIHKEGETLFTETDMPCVRGQVRTLWAKASPLRDDQGNVIGAIETVRDITERKKMEEDLRNTKELAEAANQAKSEFLANMSHEIRTPMNGVIGMIGLLLDTELADDQRDYAETVRNSADNLLTVLNDILDFSKVEAGKLDLEVIDFDLRTAVEDVIDMQSLRAQDKGLEYIFVVHPEVPSNVRGDPGRLRQTLLNLTNNAIKFTEKGEIAVHVRLEEETDSHVKVLCTVEDTGIGIPAGKMDCLFKSFSQADASTTRKYGGTGLGLAISKQLVEMMGGQIGVESREGRGSKFWFTILFEKQQTAVKPQIPAMKEDFQSRHILVVDDNITNQRILGAYLQSWNCRHSIASSGAEALYLLKRAISEQNAFDTAIVDMLMPGMDGEALGRNIKSDPDLKKTVLVMLTSAGNRGDASRLKEIGFAAYLTKPVKPSQLFHCLATVMFGQEETAIKQEQSLVTQYTIREGLKNNVRVLIAEDNTTNQKVAQLMLKKLGYEADVVADGAEAIKAIAHIPYGLIFMDVQMPELDGFEATAIIRGQEKKLKTHVPIIAMTAHALKGDRERCIAAGMDDYISKPIHPQELIDTISRCLSSSHQYAEKEIFDKKTFLDRFDGDSDLCDEILTIFTEDFPVQLEGLKNALKRRDVPLVERLGHTLKGAAANVEAGKIKSLAYEVEKAGKTKKIKPVDALITELEYAFEQFMEAAQKKHNPNGMETEQYTAMEIAVPLIRNNP